MNSWNASAGNWMRGTRSGTAINMLGGCGARVGRSFQKEIGERVLPAEVESKEGTG